MDADITMIDLTEDVASSALSRNDVSRPGRQLASMAAPSSPTPNIDEAVESAGSEGEEQNAAEFEATGYGRYQRKMIYRGKSGTFRVLAGPRRFPSLRRLIADWHDLKKQPHKSVEKVPLAALIAMQLNDRAAENEDYGCFSHQWGVRMEPRGGLIYYSPHRWTAIESAVWMLQDLSSRILTCCALRRWHLTRAHDYFMPIFVQPVGAVNIYLPMWMAQDWHYGAVLLYWPGGAVGVTSLSAYLGNRWEKWFEPQARWDMENDKLLYWLSLGPDHVKEQDEFEQNLKCDTSGMERNDLLPAFRDLALSESPRLTLWAREYNRLVLWEDMKQAPNRAKAQRDSQGQPAANANEGSVEQQELDAMAAAATINDYDQRAGRQNIEHAEVLEAEFDYTLGLDGDDDLLVDCYEVDDNDDYESGDDA